MKSGNIINATAQGMTTRSFHPHWNDVNSVSVQRKTKEDQAIELAKWSASYAASKERQKGRRILYPV